MKITAEHIERAHRSFHFYKVVEGNKHLLVAKHTFADIDLRLVERELFEFAFILNMGFDYIFCHCFMLHSLADARYIAYFLQFVEKKNYEEASYYLNAMLQNKDEQYVSPVIKKIRQWQEMVFSFIGERHIYHPDADYLLDAFEERFKSSIEFNADAKKFDYILENIKSVFHRYYRIYAHRGSILIELQYVDTDKCSYLY